MYHKSLSTVVHLSVLLLGKLYRIVYTKLSYSLLSQCGINWIYYLYYNILLVQAVYPILKIDIQLSLHTLKFEHRVIDRTLGVKAHLIRRINFRFSGLLGSNTVRIEGGGGGGEIFQFQVLRFHCDVIIHGQTDEHTSYLGLHHFPASEKWPTLLSSLAGE